jgi:potassium-transporting ATPase KdpC subunit
MNPRRINLKPIVTSIIAVLVLTVALGVLYPLVITGIGQLAFPGNANGQLVYHDGKLVASKLIGQQYTDVVHTKSGKVKMSDGEPVTVPDKRYFQTRPSGNVPPDGDAATEFANLGPNDKITEQTLAARIKEYLTLEKPYDPGLTTAQIPVDAIDTSASGVDPDISPANAAIQAHRVAAVRHIPLTQVTALVHRFTGGRGLGFSGEPTVNVVELNLALDHEGH